MFCPRCATENANDASFCRACGADIHLVSQALTGRLAVAPSGARTGTDDAPAKSKSKELGPARLDKIFENIFVGLAFLAIFLGGLFFYRGALMIWVWFIIPAFACMGSGIGWYLRYRQEQKGRLLPPSSLAPALFAPASVRPAGTVVPSALASRDTSEMLSLNAPAPPSVTEGTTRHLDSKATPASARAQNETD